MLTVEIRNLWNPKYDDVSGAGLYLDPSTTVYPAQANSPKPDAVSSGGVAKLDISKLEPAEHTLWIVPKNASADPVGPDRHHGQYRSHLPGFAHWAGHGSRRSGTTQTPT